MRRVLKVVALVIGGLVALFLLIGVIGIACGVDEDTGDETDSARTETAEPTPTPAPSPSATPSPAELVEQAQAKINDDDYTAAVALVAGLSTADRRRVRRAISRRIAFRARRALRAGDRSEARRALREARGFPTTSQLRAARGSLTAADARATQRAQNRKLARQQRAAARRQRAAQLRARERRREQEAAQEESAPSAPEGSCADVGQTDFPVPPGDERDADGDGIACES